MTRKINLVYEDNTQEEKEESALMPGEFGWSKLQDKLIRRLEFIESGVSIMLHNYDAYNMISKIIKGKCVGILIMGRRGDTVDINLVDFTEKEIVRDQMPLGYEIEGAASMGWRGGKHDPDAIGGTYVIPLRNAG
jgi:hypothetical protein